MKKNALNLLLKLKRYQTTVSYIMLTRVGLMNTILVNMAMRHVVKKL